MKKQTNGKTLKWLIPVCILAVLAIVCGVLGFVLGSADRPEPQEQNTKLYWNVDGGPYRRQEMSRFVNSDGYVYITFTCNGEQMRLPVIDMTIANKIDMLDVMGLHFDQNGVVTDCYRVEDFTGGIVANRYYVTTVDGNTITCNSSMTMRGYDVTFELTEKTGVWDVGTEGITCGIPGTLKKDDQIIAVRDYSGQVTDVFVIPYSEPMELYWNVDRKYDSTSKRSTREMDVTGTFTFLLACDGEQVTVRTRDYDVANAMDTMAAKCFGLEFDEAGYVTKVIHAGTASGGGSCASWYHIFALKDGYMESKKLGSASTYNGTVSQSVKVFDVSGMGAYIGEPTELRVGDQVHCLRDSLGRIAVAFVVSRQADSEIYWNVNRKWSTATSKTTRLPDADGWYHIRVAVRGKQMTVKTQDASIVQSIDARAAKCFGLKLNGDVIEKFYTPNAVTGGSTFASWYDITDIQGDQITAYKPSTKDTRIGVMTDDCEIYNVSSTAGVVGEVTTLQVGDRVHALKTLEGEVCVIFVVTRFENLPTYYNMTRKWNTTSSCTDRTPDADGYYVFEMAYQGEIVTVKTKSKSIANDIDSQAAKCVALQVYNGIVYKAIHPSNTIACKGGPSSSYTTVTAASKYGFTTQKVSNGVVTKVENEAYAWNCKVYNVSGNYVDHAGEETKIQVGDFVHCLRNKDEQVVLVYVLQRYEDLPVYYNLDRNWITADNCTGRTPDAEGLYSFRMAHDGQEVIVKTASLEVANAIDSQVAKVLGLEFDENGLVIKAIHAKDTQECKGGIGVSYVKVTAIDGNQVTTYKPETGATVTITISDQPNIFDVSADAKVNQGERTTLRVGDLIHCLKSGDGKTHYVYVMSRLPVQEEVEHTCEHGGEDTVWYAWDGQSDFPVSGHYVLTQDAELPKRITIELGKEITLCLNGHTVTSADRFFAIYGTLNICDHKDEDGNYTGKLSSSASNVVDGDGKITTKVYGTIAYLYNSNGCSQLNIYGGIFEHTGSAYAGALVYIANTAANEENIAEFNLYDGILTGGTAVDMGGAVMISNCGSFNMYGGTITDCTSKTGGGVMMSTAYGSMLMEGGTITDCTSTANGAGVSVESGAFMMSGGTISGNTATGSGGGVNMQSGRFVMTGGSIDGNTGNEGGNMRINKAAEVLLTDDAVVCNGNAKNGGNITTFGRLEIMGNAQITGGTVSGQGSAISVFSNYDDAVARLIMGGGKIEGDIRFASNKGDVSMLLLGGEIEKVNVYASAVTNLYVGGTVVIHQVYLYGGKTIQIHENGLEDAASIHVGAQDTSVPFATITDTQDQACFHPMDESLYQIVNDNNDLYLESLIVSHEHCICAGNAQGVGDHTSCTDITFDNWGDDPSQWTNLPTSGNICLTHDITLSAMVELKDKTTLNICLNGHTITGPGGGKRVFLIRDAHLNITDCGETGTITNAATSALNGGLIYTYNGDSSYGYNNSVNLYGGTLTMTGTAKAGGVLYLGNQDNATVFSTFNMYGGTITGGTVSSHGGNVQAAQHSVLNIYGGTISDGTAGTTGGNINLGNATVNMTGGTITGGTAATFGGGVYAGSTLKEINLSGTANINDNFLANGTKSNVLLRHDSGKNLYPCLNVGALEEGAYVGVAASYAATQEDRSFGTAEVDASYLHSDKEDMEVICVEGELFFQQAE